MTLRPLTNLKGARLEDAPRYPGCVLRLACQGCGWERGYDVGKIINRLYELRDGGFGTPVADVAKSVKRRCPGCKGVRWATGFAYPERVDVRETKRLAGRYRS
ncbi:hypothetical protein [Phenylobacterium sp.]|uniref:hypothetical protein n=1 Tax=Phenylobacterium sp. TaxID=1871053 RepID=UPI00286C7A37|nr:hypothetical protein [Phenylobacterium sp.]